MRDPTFGRAAIIGWPIGHSLSPRIHHYWLTEHGIRGSYQAVAVPPIWLGDAVAMFREGGWRGFNVTVPHKETIMARLDRIDPVALKIGAVNTIVALGDGRLEGRNTDAAGFLNSLTERQALRVDLPAAILGAGGAGRAVLAALAGARVPEIRLANRNRARAEALAANFPAARVWDWERRAEMLEGVGLLANTTSLGMTGQPPLDIDLTRLPAGSLVTDLVYRPLETPLLADASRRGNLVIDGLGMLLHQAVQGFAAWFGITPKVTPALRAHLLGIIRADG